MRLLRNRNGQNGRCQDGRRSRRNIDTVACISQNGTRAVGFCSRRLTSARAWGILRRMEPVTLTHVFLGLSRSDGRPDIDPLSFAHFLGEVVIPLFPGLTVTRGFGYWRSNISGRTMREDSRVLTIVHDGSAEMSERIEALRNAYKGRFAQETTLRVDTEGSADHS